MNLTQLEIDWLTRWELVDEHVDLPDVRLHVGGAMGLYLRATNHGAITTGNSIWFRAPDRRKDPDLLVHELVHVGQYNQLGRFAFIRKYVADVVRKRSYSRDHPLEIPAYERQAQAKEIVKQHGGPAGVNL